MDIRRLVKAITVVMTGSVVFACGGSDDNTVLGTTDTNTGDQTTPAANLSVVIDGVLQNRDLMTVSYTVSNTGNVDAGPFNVHFLLDSATVPAPETTTGIAVSRNVAAGETVSLGYVVIPTGDTGTAYAIVDPENAVIESDESDNVSPGIRWNRPFHTPLFFDFQTGVAPSELLVSGDTEWVIDNTEDPAYSFMSNMTADLQQTCFEIYVDGASTLTFDYKLVTDTTDNFFVSQNGSLIWSAHTTTDWTPVQLPVATGNVASFKWCYIDRTTGGLSSHAAWVDNIQFY